MVLYRSSQNRSVTDYSATYTATVNSEIHQGTCESKYIHNSVINEDIIVGNNISCCNNMLRNCKNFASNIYIYGSSAITIAGMLQEGNQSLRKNVWFNSSRNNYFNLTDNNSIVGSEITWTDMTNGFYSQTYNIYCYNNLAN